MRQIQANIFTMGAGKSKPKSGDVNVKSTPEAGKVKIKSTGEHTPFPEDVQPYEGPPLECLLVTVPVQMSSHFTTGVRAGNTAATSNIDAYYPTIAGYLQQGYSLNTFYRVPGLSSMSGFGQVQLPFEAVYSKPVGAIPNPEGTRLLVEKSTMHLQQFHGGILSTTTPMGTVANTSDIMNKIIHHTSMGGKLICLEINGQVVTQGMSAAMSGISHGIGVDVLFEVPNQPMPAKYVYQVINVPIGFTVKVGFKPQPTVHCDWLGTLAMYLNQGWKLVEIFLDQSQQSTGAFSTTGSLNSLWFFEKKSSKLQDPTPVYQGTVIEYMHKVSVGFAGTSLKTDWSQVISEMGQRGWELACIQETPEVYHSGIGKIKMKLIMFFQRKIVGGTGAMAPPPYPGPSTINPPDQGSVAPYPSSQPPVYPPQQPPADPPQQPPADPPQQPPADPPQQPPVYPPQQPPEAFQQPEKSGPPS